MPFVLELASRLTIVKVDRVTSPEPHFRRDRAGGFDALSKKPSTLQEHIQASFDVALKEVERRERWWSQLSDAERQSAPDVVKDWFAKVTAKGNQAS